MSKGENELLSADFESGMLVGFADGLSQVVLTERIVLLFMLMLMQ